MTTLRTAAQQALEVLKSGLVVSWHSQVVTDLEAALAEPQEPVKQCMAHGECFGGECIYTSPPQRPADPVQEPVAWMHTDPDNPRVKFLVWRENEPAYRGVWIKTPLYAAPPQRKED